MNEGRVGQSGGQRQASWQKNMCETRSVVSAAGWEETREGDHQIAIGSEGADTATRTWHGTRETSSVAGCRLTCTSIRVKNQGGMSYHLMQRPDTGAR
jgi:hypothetical protein